MRVYLNSITGVDDAMVALLMSKRTWTAEKESEIRNLVSNVTNRDGTIREDVDEEDLAKFNKKLETLLRIGKEHITLLRYIDISFTVEGLHRGGQDDWDSHAARYNNRIIRSSTRLATFGQEKSDFYKDKIITTDEALQILGIEVPETIEVDGVEYVKAVNGYIKKGLENDKDVMRGLYMLSIPSNFSFKVNLTEFAHVFKMRNMDTHANPEVKELAESCLNKIESVYPQLNRELLMMIEN